MHATLLPLVGSAAPRALWPDAAAGAYLIHDALGSVELARMLRVRDRLVVMFEGCDEEFWAEDLDALVEGPLTTPEITLAHGVLKGRQDSLR